MLIQTILCKAICTFYVCLNSVQSLHFILDIVKSQLLDIDHRFLLIALAVTQIFPCVTSRTILRMVAQTLSSRVLCLVLCVVRLAFFRSLNFFLSPEFRLFISIFSYSSPYYSVFLFLLISLIFLQILWPLITTRAIKRTPKRNRNGESVGNKYFSKVRSFEF